MPLNFACSSPARIDAEHGRTRSKDQVRECKLANFNAARQGAPRKRKLGTRGRHKRIFFSKRDSEVGFRAFSLIIVEGLPHELVLN